MQERKEIRKLNDGGNLQMTAREMSLALVQPLSLTPYKSNQTRLATKRDLAMIFLKDGGSDQDIPVKLAA
jgi:hypothetical protein